MFTTDDYGRSKKTDSRQQRTTVLSVSTLGLCAAGLLFLLFVYDGRPPATQARLKSVQLDEDGFEICHVPNIQRPEEFFDDIETVTTSCGSMVQLGKTAISEIIDEDWGTATRCNESAAHFQWICLDKRLKIQPPNCLVYSVGVDPEFTFEHDVERLGCEVFAFDTLERVDDHQRSGRIWFQNVRIGSQSFDAALDGKVIEKRRNLHQVIENLGHQHRIIDILKLDVRDHEWEALDEFVSSMVMDQVKQLVVTLNFRPSVDTHYIDSDPTTLMDKLVTYYGLLRMLDCDGFRVFSALGRGDPMRVTGMKRSFYPEYEISYINTNFYH